jgi:hypothetical protein
VETGERISNSTVFPAFEVGLLWNAKTAMGRIVQFPHHPQAWGKAATAWEDELSLVFHCFYQQKSVDSSGSFWCESIRFC